MSDAAPPRGPFGADLGPRVISAVVLVPVTLLAVYLGGVWFALLVGGVFAGVHREWQTMTLGRRPGPKANMVSALLVISALAFCVGGALAALLIVAIGCIATLTFGGSRLWNAFGFAFFGISVMAILATRGDSLAGIYACLFLGAAIWLTDTGAYFTGRIFGGAKLSPDISPSKTWSGAIGGLATGTLLAFVVWLFATESPWWLGLVFGAVLSVSGQIGDLAESAIKRRFRIKDSGDIIPGHGGLMDRLDSLSFAALALFCIGAIHQDTTHVAEGFLIWP